MASSREELNRRVQNAIIQHSVFRWESAAVIALTLLLSFFGAFPPEAIAGWFPGPLVWLLGGLIAEALLVYSSIKDPHLGQQVVADILRHTFEPGRLRNPELQSQVQKGLDYRTRIQAAIQTQSDSLLKDNLTETATQIDEWLENVYHLAERLDRYREQVDLLTRDRQAARSRLQELRQKLGNEPDEAVRRQIEVTISSLQRQIETIDSLENTMKRARLQLENTLSALGTIYSQTMLVDAKDIDSGRARRLQHEIAEEVHELSDLLHAMDEVYVAKEGEVAGG